MTPATTDRSFPPLPLEEWEPTKDTLHLWLQIVGKVRLALFPKKNHWWHAPLYVSARGLTTRPIPYEGDVFAVTFDFLDHRLRAERSDGRAAGFALADGLSVARFYEQTFDALDEIGVAVEIQAEPFDCFASGTPFAECSAYASYDRAAIERFWRVLVAVGGVLEAFRGRFIGKSSPVHLFWHSFDLALTRFSGRRAPAMPDADSVTQEAYSHEVISFGFWAGDKSFREPAFYAYAWPLPDGLTEEPLHPGAAYWGTPSGGNPRALLPYAAVREEASAREAISSFLQSAYEAGAKCANWNAQHLALENAVP